VANFFERFSTKYFNSIKQDPTIEFQEKIIKQFMQFALQTALLECSLVKHGQGILRINKVSMVYKLSNLYGDFCNNNEIPYD
jgi:hypothetical protein